MSPAGAFENRIVRLVGTGWTGTAIYSYASGPSLNVTDGTDVSLTALGSDRPNEVSDPRSGAAHTTAQWFNTAAFVKQAPGTFGTTPRNAVPGPSVWNTDIGAWRAIPIHETTNIVFRFEAFNVFNHTRLAPPVTAINSANFGKILVAGDPRILQAAVKLNF